MFKHSSLFIFLLSGIARIGMAQNRIEGYILDDKSKPFSFCALALLNSKDSTQVKGNITNENGFYTFESVTSATYIIKASAVGFDDVFSSLLVIDSLSKIKMNALVLKTRATNLNEVSVSVIKKPVEFKNGNIIVNIDGSPLAIGNSVYDVLTRMPGVMVDGDNITLQGKAVSILIDNRIQQIAGAQMISVLKSMNASNIEKIELVTNPSAKYDAAGSGGLINILTKKIKITGFSGNLMVNSSQGFYNNTFAQLSLNYKGKKISVFTNYNASYSDTRAENHWHREVRNDSTLTLLDQKYVETSHNRYVSFLGGIDLFINKKSTLSARIDFRPGKDKIIRHATTGISDNSLGYNNLAFEFEKLNDWFWQDYSLNYDLLLDTIGSKLTVNASYNTYPERWSASYQNHYYDANYKDVVPLKAFKSENKVDLNVVAGRVDLEKNFSNKLRLEAGVKATSQNLFSDFVFENKDPSTGLFSPDTGLTNAFSYKEQIQAGYIEMSKSVKKFNYRVGVRGENTIILAQNKTNSVRYDRTYFNLFPVASVDYNYSDNHNFSLSYNKRIMRPNYLNFNPYKSFRSILTYMQGNPFLNPMYVDRFEFRHTYKGKFSNSLSYSYHKNYFLSYNIENTKTKELIFYNGNLAQAEIFSYNLFYQGDLFKWWSFSANIGVHYFRCKGTIEGVNYSSVMST
ncbi:MAG: TonB-dependent receptor [Bacteroidetes bacterium]|nr:TonB-dependent receptor [Bacteroidota bacterium]